MVRPRLGPIRLLLTKGAPSAWEWQTIEDPDPGSSWLGAVTYLRTPCGRKVNAPTPPLCMALRILCVQHLIMSLHRSHLTRCVCASSLLTISESLAAITRMSPLSLTTSLTRGLRDSRARCRMHGTLSHASGTVMVQCSKMRCPADSQHSKLHRQHASG